MKEEKFVLDFEERALIACLTTPILIFDSKEELEKLCEEMLMGSKGGLIGCTRQEYEEYIKQVLKKLVHKLGF
jgi:hypothetical protein